MKKHISILILTLLLSNMVFSQLRQERRERIKSLKIAFITEKLSLTNEEAQKFWPIYNSFEEESDKIRQELQNIKNQNNLKDLTENKAKELLNELSSLETKRYELNRNYMKNLMTAISSKKIIMLKEAEQSFNRRMIEEYRNRRQERRNN